MDNGWLHSIWKWDEQITDVYRTLRRGECKSNGTAIHTRLFDRASDNEEQHYYDISVRTPCCIRSLVCQMMWHNPLQRSFLPNEICIFRAARKIITNTQVRSQRNAPVLSTHGQKKVLISQSTFIVAQAESQCFEFRQHSLVNLYQHILLFAEGDRKSLP